LADLERLFDAENDSTRSGRFNNYCKKVDCDFLIFLKIRFNIINIIDFVLLRKPLKTDGAGYSPEASVG